MSFYTGEYSSGIYAGTYSSKYGGTALRKMNSLNTTQFNQNTVAKNDVAKKTKAKKFNDSNYALATISLMAISAVAGYSLKGGFKNIGAGIGKAATAVENFVKKGTSKAATATKTTCSNIIGKVKNLFQKT